MRERDPLDEWMFSVQLLSPESTNPSGSQELHQRLLAFAEVLDTAPAGKPDYYRSLMIPSLHYFGTLPAPAVSTLAQRLYRQVWERGGSGSNYALERLLEVVALSMTEEAIPFWQSLLDLSKPRDQGAQRRRTAAVAALALMAIRRQLPAAFVALEAGLQHRLEQVRALSVLYLFDVYLTLERPLPEALQQTLLQIAINDPAFAPRFQARLGLRALGIPAPLAHAEAAYHLKVRLLHDTGKASRTLALRSEQTLEELHFAIQRAFEWDADHLYSFFLNNKPSDDRYEISCPEATDDWSFDLLQSDELFDLNPFDQVADAADQDQAGQHQNGVEPALLDAADTEESGIDTTNTCLGDLGLSLKHKFIYLFDYGDNHEFEVSVVAIESPAAPGDYPRLIASEGLAPRQYDYSEDDELEDDDEAEPLD